MARRVTDREIEALVPQVDAMARRLWRKDVDLDDLRSAGRIGLIAAAERWEGRALFSTYAFAMARGYILHSIRDQLEVRRLNGMERPASLSEETEDGLLQDELVGAAMDPADAAIHAAVRRELRHAVETLNSRQRAAIELMYGQGLSYSDLAREIGVTRQGARQLVLRAIEELRAQLSSDRDSGLYQ